MRRFTPLCTALALAALACGRGASVPTVAPTIAAEPSDTALVPSVVPSQTASPAEEIWIRTPGNGSRLVGAVHIEGEADPTFEQTLVVQLVALDEEPFPVLAQQSVTIGADVGQRGPFQADLTFDLGVTAERPAAVNVFATSARDGGITHLASVQVTLAGAGAEVLREGEAAQERIAISSPAAGAALSGGVAHVEGFGWAAFEQTLLVEIVDVNGAVVGSSSVIVQAPDLGYPGPFTVDVPYSPPAAGPGRVIVRDVSPAFGQTIHQATVDIDLSP